MTEDFGKYDAIIVGAGFAGAVSARRLAESGMRIAVVEKRKHIGGNAYDYTDENELLVHKYGPHIFHTNSKTAYDFLSRFTDWNGYEHKVEANIHGSLILVPFNFKALYDVFDKDEAHNLEMLLLQTYGDKDTVSILELMKNKNPSLEKLGTYIYENIFLHYTEKQWGTDPKRIDPSTIARVPIRLSNDCRYFTDSYQGLPSCGYTELFKKLLRHPNISVFLNTDCKSIIRIDGDKLITVANRNIYNGIFIYTGEVDALLGMCYSPLPYRTLDFEFEHIDAEYFQPCGTVNYTVDKPYTRITEFKHMTLQKSPSTTVLKEYSRAFVPESNDIPYYPVINEISTQIYGKYISRLSKIKNLYLTGRLAEYKYYNMDAVTLRAIELTDKIIMTL